LDISGCDNLDLVGKAFSRSIRFNSILLPMVVSPEAIFPSGLNIHFIGLNPYEVLYAA